MTDQEFIDTFTAGQLAPAGFDHRAHLRAAFLLLRDRPFLEACVAMRDGLQALAGKLGKPDLYHETMTVAFMALVAERAPPGPDDWDAFIEAHPELCERGLLDSYYSTALLASGAARTRFILPDRSKGRHD
ncbi:hypothetical protein ACI48D_00505 [Massilia sp. LXY-6]|uniref:hypothetical protein n=1 Tax=Massilia sp. LXY-6 TaxID=3379823 RepID=UPI003EE1A12D